MTHTYKTRIDEDFVRDGFDKMEDLIVNTKIEIISTLTDTFDKRFTGIESRLGGVENRLVSVENRLGSVETRLDTMDENLVDISGQLKSINIVLNKVAAKVL